MVSLVRHDLEFILQQIRISEAHAAGVPLTDMIDHPLEPYGLRTVDGSWNNLIPGREDYGAADQPFPRLTDPDFRDGEMGTSYEQTSGTVVDSAPRTISNLIVDQSTNNAAAVEAAGYTGSAPIDSLFIANVAPDAGTSAPFNSFLTFFGQFFDHGLDLVSKGGSGTVFIPLKPDDPLYNPDSPTNFMVLTRATNLPGEDGVLGTADDVHEHTNQTTPFVDLNQTYGSNASTQVFLREYALDGDGRPAATGLMLSGEAGGLPTWADIKAQARALLGIELTDADVTNGPLLATDPYGRFIPGANGFAQIVMAGADGIAGTADDYLVEGNPLAPISTDGAVRNGHAFLDDIAHAAAPRNGDGSMKTADDDDAVGLSGDATTYDDELLDSHFIAGDGRANENIGLTTVHTVFHAEHNRQVESIKEVILATGDQDFIAQWLVAGADQSDGVQDVEWNGEYLFQAGRFATEMQYQHLVFEEFARKIMPQIDVFQFQPSTDIDPAIVAEFAHTVYRFGHSMLTETMARTDADGTSDDLALIDAFLNPLAFDDGGAISADAAAGAIVRGLTRQVGNEIDEFVTGAVRNNLLGLPLDLAAINLARGRDTGVPSLNTARAQFYEMTLDAQLKPYVSWYDFALNLKNPASLINFIAAYGQHDSVLAATTLDGKRAAAAALVLGGEGAPEDRLDFLNSTGAWASAESGLNLVDFWIGGLAEQVMQFGSMLGSTFAFVFETQLERLQDGDRFYYLSRTQGLNLLNELESNSFAELVKNNTDLGDADAAHLPGDLFAAVDHILEIDPDRQLGADPTRSTAGLPPLVVRRDTDGDGDADVLEYNGDAHVVLGGSDEDDVLIAGEGDDTVWGDDGNDRIEGGRGVDILHGGAGDDIITDSGTDIGAADVIHGEEGDDVILGGDGNDLLFGNEGRDFIHGGRDFKTINGGLDDDFIVGSTGIDFILGAEGDDWIEAGDSADVVNGDNSELNFNSTIIGHDVLFGGRGDTDFDGESGDDIMVQGEGIDRNEGMFGFDWVIHKTNNVAADTDLNRPIFTSVPAEQLRDRFDMVEGASGWKYDDVIRGDDRALAGEGGEGDFDDHVLTQEGIDRIDGLQELLGVGVTSFRDGNILLGGDGSDILEGRGANDFLDGDAWLNVRISVRDRLDPSIELMSVDSLTQIQAQLLSGAIKTSQLQVVREILVADGSDDIDTAVFSDVFANYDFVRAADGTFTITHARGEPNDNGFLDGADIVRNVERLQFADGIVDVSQPNRAATGEVFISDTTPREGQSLSATAFVDDADGVNFATLTYVWQMEVAPDEWVDVAEGNFYQPDDPQIGHRLRVEVRFRDALGSLETVVSAPTAVVNNLNDAPTGRPAVSDTSPTEGQTLTADRGDLDDADGMTTSVITYEWQQLVNGTWTAVGTGENFTPAQAQVGRQLRVVATFTDDYGTVQQVASTATAVVGDLWIGTSTSNSFTGAGGDDDASGLGGNDTLNGAGGNDRLDGGDGDDALAGAAGDDLLIGGAGADTLNGGVGADAMEGGAGNDTYVVDDFGDLVSELPGGGTDTVRTNLFGYVLGENVENLVYTGTDGFSATGNALANRIQGGAGADYLDGGEGADTLVGGAGDDVYVIDQGGDQITEGSGGGIDTVYSSASVFTLGANVENLWHVGVSAAHLTGNTGANEIFGGFEADVLEGLAGADTLDGGFGDDVMEGGTGDDVLIGGFGDDQMDGGTGDDRFVLTFGFGHDVIDGFDPNATSGQDRLDVTALGITTADFDAQVSIQQVGRDTLITIGDSSVRLLRIDADDITRADFFLAP